MITPHCRRGGIRHDRPRRTPPLVVVVVVVVVVARGGACAGGRRQCPPSALRGRCRSCPPPSLARAEDGGARGDAILVVLLFEAIIVVALDILEKFRALRRHLTAASPEGKDMKGGGRGGPAIFPHPDDDDARCLLDGVGSTNTNDDKTTTPPHPPPKTMATPRGGRGAGTTTVPDDDVTAVAASRDTVATNATNATNEIGPRGARDLRAAVETSWSLCLEQIILCGIVRTYLHKYLQIPADICADIWSRQQISGQSHIGINMNH